MNPCIIDTSCIHLAVDGDSNLGATLEISADAGNCAACHSDGLYVPCVSTDPCDCNAIESHDGIWVPKVSQAIASVGPGMGAPYDDLVVTGPLTPAGEIIARSGSFTWTTPECGSGNILGSQLVGPVHIANISPGGRVITGFQTKINPNPYAGGPFTVYRNSGTVLGEVAFPVNNGGPTVDPIGPGVTQTMEWKQTYQVTAGTVGSITFHSIFMYAWMVHIATYGC